MVDSDYDRVSLLLQDTAALLSEAREVLESLESACPGYLRAVNGHKVLVAIMQHEERLAVEGY
jgi:hypothetical protein